jgi:hypothetical protein
VKRIDMDEFQQALNVFYNTKLHPDLKCYQDYFARYLDNKMMFSVAQDGFVISEAAHRRLQLLLTPHGETVLRVWAIRQQKLYKGKEPPTITNHGYFVAT